jgi:phosphoglycerate dehydrogenase-like enzyme
VAKVKVLVPREGLLDELGELPEGVELVHEPADDVEIVLLTGSLEDLAGELIGRLPRLRVVQVGSAGVDWVEPFVPAGVALHNGVGVHDIPVAEWAVAALLGIQRRFPEFRDLQRAERWDREALAPIEDLYGKRVVILGYGSIGRALAERLRPFGADVVGVARRARPGVETVDALPELLPTAHAVVVLLPLSPETDRLVDAAFLARLRPGALLVNAGRGRVVDTAALIEAAAAGRIRAALDVTDPEPLPAGHPLWSTPNVFITPHMGGAVARWHERFYRLAGDQLRRYARGEPLANRC